MAKSDREPFVDLTQLVDDLFVGGTNIHARLVARRRFLRRRGYFSRRSFYVCMDRLGAQLDTIRGLDVVFHRLFSQITRLNSGRQVSCPVEWMCRFARRIGQVEHMASLANRVRGECALSDQAKWYLDRLILLLNGVLIAELGVRLAVAMALHPRLGSGSILSSLGGDLLPLCIPSLVCEPVGLWQTALSK